MNTKATIHSIKTGIREFGTYDPFDKNYAHEFVVGPTWEGMSPEDASAFVGEVLAGVRDWLIAAEYDELDSETIPRHYAEHFAMEWDEANEGSPEDYQTFCKHDPRVLEIAPDLINGY